MNAIDLLSDLIRCAIRAPEGQLLRVADLANVESRILGWVSGDPKMQDVFSDTDPMRDIYKDFGTELLGKPVGGITKAERDYCKPPALGCGYGLGAKGLVAYAHGMGVEMTEEQAQHAVEVFRTRYERVPALWRRLELASIAAVDRRDTLVCGRVTFEYDRPFLFMYLPSGRRLAYFKPQVADQATPWGEMRPSLTYEGVDQYTRKWSRLSTFGGKWTEQICQAISRDLLAHGMVLAHQLGFEVVGHTHDELIALTGADDWRDHDVLAWCMYQRPAWADAELHLDAAGFSDVVYRKD